PLTLALPEAQQEQRRYAKRQWTWFRAEPAFHWLAGCGDESRIQAEAIGLLRRFIAPGVDPVSP
ncbi:MAG: tRNA (adenosine(37)-N6)-dimethylallyltransferase MiaA, partial [Terriglobales bacterium]